MGKLAPGPGTETRCKEAGQQAYPQEGKSRRSNCGRGASRHPGGAAGNVCQRVCLADRARQEAAVGSSRAASSYSTSTSTSISSGSTSTSNSNSGGTNKSTAQPLAHSAPRSHALIAVVKLLAAESKPSRRAASPTTFMTTTSGHYPIATKHIYSSTYSTLVLSPR